MKLAIATSTLVTLASASILNMSHMINNITSGTAPSNLRTFGTVEQILLSDYQNYGCWCFLAQSPKGKGQPVNSIDHICRSLLQGYECIEIDSVASGETCVPHEQSYNDANVNFMTSPSDGDILDACLLANGGVVDCAVRVCTIEVAFLRDWWPIQQQIYANNFDAEVSKFSHVNAGVANFDYDTECSITKGAVSQKQCCGSYPSRFPYRIDGAYGTRACCDGKTYNTATFDCCDGDTIALSCA